MVTNIPSIDDAERGEALRIQVRLWLQQAGEQLMAHLGAQSLCELHKGGRVTGGVKYDEGRQAAYSMLARKLKGTQGDPVQIETMLSAETERWRSTLERHQNDARKSMPWIAYSQGGLDACEAALLWWAQRRLDAPPATTP